MMENGQAGSAAAADQVDWQRPADSLPNEMWDVIIVGAGPAGASAAHRLARKGRRVLLLEKSRMPREKTCGGAFSEQARSYLDFDVPEEFTDWQCYGARVHYGPFSVEVKRPNRTAVLVTRAKFDHFLAGKAEEAGAQLQFERATGLDIETDCVLLDTASGQYRAKLAIVAAGASSRLLQCVRRRDRPEEIGFCLAQDYSGADLAQFADLDGVIDVYFGVTGFGFGWVFHHGSYLSIGIGGLRSRLARPMDVMRAFWRRLGLPLGDLKPKGALVPCGGVRRRIVRDRVLLAGDSAGFVDPFYGEGIAYAIRSGQLAAETADMALSTADFSEKLLRTYVKKCNREFGRNLRDALVITKLMHRYPDTFIRLLASNPSVLDRYLLVPQAKSSYRGFAAWVLARLPAIMAGSLLGL